MTSTEGIALTELTKQLNSITPEQCDAYAKRLRWGTFGPTGLRPMEVRYLIDLDTDHLQNILMTQDSCPYLYRRVIIHILKNRWQLESVAMA